MWRWCCSPGTDRKFIAVTEVPAWLSCCGWYPRGLAAAGDWDAQVCCNSRSWWGSRGAEVQLQFFSPSWHLLFLHFLNSESLSHSFFSGRDNFCIKGRLSDIMWRRGLEMRSSSFLWIAHSKINNSSNLIYVVFDERLPKKCLLRLIKKYGQSDASWSFSVPMSEASMKGAELSALLQLATASQLSLITYGAGKQSLWIILTFLHRNPPPFSRVFSSAFSTNCKFPHKCKILELINSPVLILPSSRKSIALPDLQAAPLGWRCKSFLSRNRNIPERIYCLYFKVIFWNVIHCMYAYFKKQMLNSFHSLF